MLRCLYTMLTIHCLYRITSYDSDKMPSSVLLAGDPAVTQTDRW